MGLWGRWSSEGWLWGGPAIGNQWEGGGEAAREKMKWLMWKPAQEKIYMMFLGTRENISFHSKALNAMKIILFS